ncbi:zinc finger protein VAR3, chloroplastic [Canna indica]|uniref:Zinc finger protein VAR3, chloroplastic n=1 Tax=Canna indica TaxID=4628 RepID=A0AAQ3JZ92_9LILI|nr:zinc finger protein VAR3, chloroplastic [Canna indica]
MGGASKLLTLLATPSRRFSALRFARHAAVPFSALSAASSRHSCHFLLFLPHRLQLGFLFGSSNQVHSQAACAWEGFGDTVLSAPTSSAGFVHPWPEWSKLVDYLLAGGCYDRTVAVAVGEDDDSFLSKEDLTEEFVKSAQACLSFARDRPDLLRTLTKKNIEIIVENSSPSLFKNGANSARRLRSFLSAVRPNIMESESARTVDVMRYLLSNVCTSSATLDEIGTRGLIATSTRSLLAELASLIVTSSDSKLTDLTPGQTTINHGQFSRPSQQNIEMKRGDWICPKCSFMNFARNTKCIECNEARPKRVVTGGEWECPQCDFFNYSRNMSCLRCDCKRPRENPLSASSSDAALGNGGNSNSGQILNRSGLDKSEIERKLAANDEKAARWFSKISQLDDSADLSSAIDDEDFPEIMPMRKGVNRFVVSTRKTPLERRFANAQNKSNMVNSGSSEGNELQSGGSKGVGSHKDSEISQMLDRILGHVSTSSGTNKQVAEGGNTYGTKSAFSSSGCGQADPNYVPFVPADMLNKHSNAISEQSLNRETSASTKASQLNDSVLEFESSTESKNIGRCSIKATEFDNVNSMTDATSDDNFPEIMPMRRGENRFIVSNKKDRTLTSPGYKRRIAMEQANGSSFVPFVPFPPDYFVKKNRHSEASPARTSISTASALHEKAQNVSGKSDESTAASHSSMSENATVMMTDNWSANQIYHDTSDANSYGVGSDKHKMDASNCEASANSAQLPSNSWSNQSETWSSRPFGKNTPSGPGVSSGSHQPEIADNAREGWKSRFTGKSLEGSAVTEPDPLDMSEEAKAARWFRRAAQIKDISELSNIPDEDFPEIMPMRKGVNRFVVSKRKTPLERRLTSSQYRRNLPIISSDPDKDSN